MGKKEINGKENHTTRIGKLFFRDLFRIQELRVKNGVDKKKTSIKKLTNLITKHNSWPTMRNDLVNVKIRGDDL